MDLFETAKVSIDTVRLKKVTLENYRNFPFVELTFDEQGNVLSGKNGIGKTNVIEAVYWVLSGRLLNGVSQSHLIGVTPLNADKGTKTKVKLEFTTGFIVEKVFWEKWGDDGVYNGTDTSFYINGSLEKRVSGADRAIKRALGIEDVASRFSDTKLKDIDLIALLNTVDYLQGVDYKLLRELITDIVGEIDFKEIMNANPEKYGRLVEPLKQHGLSVENLKEATRSAKFGNKNQDGVMDMIKATENTIHTLELEAEKAVDENTINGAKARIDGLEAEKNEITLGLQKGINETLSELQAKINEKKLEINDMKDKIRKDFEAKQNNDEVKRAKSDIESKEQSIKDFRNVNLGLTETISNLNSEKQRLTSTLQSKQRRIDDLQEQRQDLLAQWNKTKEPTTSEQVTCPHCEKPFGLHECKEHKAIVDSEKSKINLKGQKVKTELEELNEGVSIIQKEIEAVDKQILVKQKEKEQNNKNIEFLQEEIAVINKTLNEMDYTGSTIDFDTPQVLEATREVQRLKAEKNNAELDLITKQQKDKARVETIKIEIEKLMETVNAETTRNAYLKTAQSERDKLAELKRKRNDLDDTFTLIKELERETFEKLDSKLSKAFGENFGFQLYKINIDETIDTRVCEMFVKDKWNNMVNIKNINNGMLPIRVLEFIAKVKEHYQIKPSFVLVDEIGNLDTEHRDLLKQYGEQIIATQGSDYEKLKKETV